MLSHGCLSVALQPPAPRGAYLQGGLHAPCSSPGTLLGPSRAVMPTIEQVFCALHLVPRYSNLAQIIRYCEDVVILDLVLSRPLKFFFVLSYFWPGFLYPLHAFPSYCKSSLSYKKGEAHSFLDVTPPSGPL